MYVQLILQNDVKLKKPVWLFLSFNEKDGCLFHSCCDQLFFFSSMHI